MKRREFIQKSVTGVTAATMVVSGNGLSLALDKAKSQLPAEITGPPFKGDGRHLFPQNVPPNRWARFEAAGFTEPACGIVYHRDMVVPHGMPLGGVATGCMDIDTDGSFGYFNLFNSGVPTRGPIGHPFLGVVSGERCWLLTTQDVTGVENASDIYYWVYFPVADLEYQIDAPFTVGLRAWTPFVPGDSKTSNTPAAIFEVHLRNKTNQAQIISLGLSFPGPTQAEAQISPTQRTRPSIYRLVAIVRADCRRRDSLSSRRRKSRKLQWAGWEFFRWHLLCNWCDWR